MDMDQNSEKYPNLYFLDSKYAKEIHFKQRETVRNNKYRNENEENSKIRDHNFTIEDIQTKIQNRIKSFLAIKPERRMDIFDMLNQIEPCQWEDMKTALQKVAVLRDDKYHLNSKKIITAVPIHKINSLGQERETCICCNRKNEAKDSQIKKISIQNRIESFLSIKPEKRMDIFDMLNQIEPCQWEDMKTALEEIAVLCDDKYHLKSCIYSKKKNGTQYSKTEKKSIQKRIERRSIQPLTNMDIIEMFDREEPCRWKDMNRALDEVVSGRFDVFCLQPINIPKKPRIQLEKPKKRTVHTSKLSRIVSEFND